MEKIKKYIKSALSPLFSKPVVSNYNRWTGNYDSWDAALKDSEGYDAEQILEKCKNALLKVKNGEAVYERDSVVFDEIEYSWGLLSGLQKAAIDNDCRLNVLDFGGSLGSSYFQNRKFLSGLKTLQWTIVEQKNFVDTGKSNFENEELHFFYTIEDSLKIQVSNVLLLSSVIQYLDDPYKWIKRFISLKLPYIIIDRVAFVNQGNDILTIQNISPEIYKASYPAWFFNFENFVRLFSNYRLIAHFNSHEGYIINLDDNRTAFYKGLILQYDK